MNQFKFRGKIRKLKENGYTEQTYDSGWMTRKLKFTMACGDNSHFFECSGGKWKDDAKNVVYTFSKGTETEKGKNIQVAWADRTKTDVMDNVAAFRKYIIDTEIYSVRQEIKESGDDVALAESMKKHHEFLAQWDFVDTLNKLVSSEKAKDMIFEISGNIEYSYSAEKDKYYMNYVPTRVYRVADDAKQICEATMDVFFTADSVDETMVEETGNILVNAHTQYYDRNVKKNVFAPVSFVIKSDNPKAEGFKKMFAKAQDDQVRKVGLTIECINGAQKTSITEAMLSDEQKELIEWGLATFEDIKKEMGGEVYGDKIVENRIVDLVKGNKRGSEETLYSAEDLNKRPVKEEVVVDLFDEDIDI
jgi:hypothetical protein